MTRAMNPSTRLRNMRSTYSLPTQKKLISQTWQDLLEKEFLQVLDPNRRVNLIVAGRSGAGKSALVNAIFGDDVAPEGAGEPVTKQVEIYVSDRLPITIWDTVGITLGKELNGALGDLQRIIRNSRLGGANEHIHLALYCFNAQNKRAEDFEFDFIRELSKEVKVLAVATQCLGRKDNDAEDIVRRINDAGLPLAHGRVFKVLAKPVEINEEVSVPTFGLEELVRSCVRILPEGAALALVSAQKVAIDMKVRTARKIVVIAASAAGGIGATPIPFVDAPIIATIQVTMIHQVTRVMLGLQAGPARVIIQASGIIGVTVSMTIGRTFARTLRRLMPFVGNMINGATAAEATRQLGNTYVDFCSDLLRRYPDGTDIPIEVLKEAIKDFFTGWGNRDRKSSTDSD